MLMSLTVYVLLLIPTQFPAGAQTGTMGVLFRRINPIECVNQVLEKILVSNRTIEEMGAWLLAPAVFTFLVFALLFGYAAPRLRAHASAESLAPARWRSSVAVTAIVCVLGAAAAPPASAQQGRADPAISRSAGETPDHNASGGAQSLLSISVDVETSTVKNGDGVPFQTTVTNGGAEKSPALVLAMNIINLEGRGDPVDPEDWSPRRTQHIESLEPGQSVSHSWLVNTIFDGEYMVYMVVVPAPGSAEATSLPVAGSGIHLTVTPFTRLNPGGVLPYSIGVPGTLLLGVVIFYRLRLRRIEAMERSYGRRTA